MGLEAAFGVSPYVKCQFALQKAREAGDRIEEAGDAAKKKIDDATS